MPPFFFVSRDTALVQATASSRQPYLPVRLSDHYDKIRDDAAFRREVAERAGIGFELPKPPIVPSVGNVPSSGEEVELATA